MGGENSEFNLDLDKLLVFEITGYAIDNVQFFTVEDLGVQGYIDITYNRDLLSLCRTIKSGDKLYVYIKHIISSPNGGGSCS